MQGLTWQVGRQPGADVERSIQMKARWRINPVGDACPVAPRKVSTRVAIDRMLKLPSGFRYVLLRHAATVLPPGLSVLIFDVAVRRPELLIAGLRAVTGALRRCPSPSHEMFAAAFP